MQHVLAGFQVQHALDAALHALEVFHQLGAKVRVSYPVYKNRFGKQEKIYQEKILFLSELCALSPKEKQKREFLIRELQISKLRLMQFAL